MTRYRIFTKEGTLGTTFSLQEAGDLLQMYLEQGVEAEYEEYDPEAKRMGRDPDLH
tara:strand:+ start:1316 stop:1483 length:168 start_codon:yes stop_codon:yes gene_type:complete